MKILALETSSHHISVALRLPDALLTRSEVLPNGGSERILPWVQSLLGEAGLALTDLDGIAYGAGPGGFTGLRLACGVAQGLAYGADLPTIGISTLEAVALNADAPKVLACLDARMDEVYAAAYVQDAEDSFVCVAQPVVLPPAEIGDFAALIEGLGSDWQGAGDGFKTYGAVLAGYLPELAKTLEDIHPTAAAVARLAVPRFLRGEGLPAAQAMPLYVRDKVALTTAERLARGGRK